jgi:hypothetical protein
MEVLILGVDFFDFGRRFLCLGVLICVDFLVLLICVDFLVHFWCVDLCGFCG